MGIRFRCHHCEHELNLKNFQAGRRARCPVCSGRFRVPTESCDFSTPVDEEAVQRTGASQSQLASPAERGVAVASAKVAAVSATAIATADRPSEVSAAQTASDSAAASSAAGPAISTAPAALLLGESWPAAIAEAPQAVWYLRPAGGGQYGPVDGTVFWQWIRENRVARDAFVWRDGWPQWQVAAEAFEEVFGPMVPLSAESGQVAGQGLTLATAASAPVADQSPGVSPVTGSVGRSKKRGAKNNYAWAIVALAVLAIALMAVLVGVLVTR